MAISHSASTAISTATSAKGATGTSVAYPAGVAAGRIAVLAVQCKPESLTISTPTGWTKLGETTGGSGSAMVADVGPTKLAVYYRILAGTESGSVTVSSTGNSMTGTTTGVMSIYEGTLGGWAVPSVVFGSDSTHGTNVAATLGAWASTPAQGDIVLCFYSADTDATTAASTATLTATGFTYAALTARSRQGNMDGFDGTLFSWQTRVSSHTAGSVAAPSFALTWSASSCGPVAAVRLHEVAPVSTLVDTFDDGVIGADTWPYSYGAVTETGGRAQTPAGTGYTGYNAAHCYTLDEPGLIVQASPAAVNGATTGEVYSAAWVNSLSQVAGTQIGFKVDTVLGVISFQNQAAYFDGSRLEIPYDPVAHAWWRLQLVAGQLVWSTSPDGRTWTQRRTAAAPAYVAGAQDFRVFLEAHRDSGTENAAEWDNVNVVPAPSAGPTGLPVAAATGSPATALALSTSPSGIAVAAALGAPATALPGSAPAGLPVQAALGAPAVTLPGAAPAGLPVAAVPGAPSASLARTAAPNGLPAAITLGAPTTALPGASPTGLAAAAALGAPATTVARSVAPSGAPIAAAPGAPATAVTLSTSPAGLAVPASLGSPSTALPGAGPAGLAVAAALGTPRVQSTLVPDGIAVAAQLGSPSTTLARAAAPAGLPVQAALGSPSSALPGAGPAGAVVAAVLGSPIAGTAGLAGASPPGLAVAASAGSPSASLARTAGPAGVAVAASLGTPAVARPPVIPAGAGVQAATGTPAATLGRSAAPAGAVVVAALGAPAVAATAGASPDGLAAHVAVGFPSVPITVIPDGIAVAVALGTLRAGEHPAVYRPNTGQVPRAADGMVPRIPAGMVPRL